MQHRNNNESFSKTYFSFGWSDTSLREYALYTILYAAGFMSVQRDDVLRIYMNFSFLATNEHLKECVPNRESLNARSFNVHA